MGDYNVVLNLEDRQKGTPFKDVETRDFQDCLDDCGLTDLHYVGRSYTWTNNHVYSRIDRAIVNSTWITQMTSERVLIMEPNFFDHSPLWIRFQQLSQNRERSFKFLNCLVESPQFMPLVAGRWKHTDSHVNLRTTWNKLKVVKYHLKTLNTTQFRGVEEKLNTIRSQLKQVQVQMGNSIPTPQLIADEKELKIQLEKWSKIEESVYRQKSRIQWLRLGDSNTAYFFANMKNKQSLNHIRNLGNAQGCILQTDSEVQSEILGVL
ncbi:uncharacterized protein LOC132608002 [Lycium barbarum]|uniref:uncharacterized protein LOC132608002 n=1 Tax=Lycium barbarum TaxID=112863 RepID=UPI00293E704D|nr:uncharacterized protein LOC132608002 [Lycium barbarum]